MGSIIFVLKGILSDDFAERVVLACDNVVARAGVWLLSTVYMKRTNREKINQRSDTAFSPKGLRECRDRTLGYRFNLGSRVFPSKNARPLSVRKKRLMKNTHLNRIV